MNTKLIATDKEVEQELEGALTGSETRQIVTPYAFNVAPELFGTPLASPFRRATALLIDLFFVALLTNVSSVFWAIFAAVMFFRAGNKVKKKSRFRFLRKALRLLAALLLFVFVLAFIDQIMPDDDSNVSYSVNENKESVTGRAAIEVVTLTAKYVAKVSNTHSAVSEGECQEAVACWSKLGKAFSKDLANSAVEKDKALELFSLISDGAEDQLEKAEIEKMISAMTQRFNLLRDKAKAEVQGAGKATESTNEKDNAVDNDDESAGYNGIVDWVVTIADDLGLGFGWAALYFTALTTWFQGRTIGKKIMGIRVIKLNNKRINLWESFERYGGYAAGLVTGLLGFLQVFWDPNRQAIQDKICETLVIDTRKPKVELELIENGKSLTPSA